MSEHRESNRYWPGCRGIIERREEENEPKAGNYGKRAEEKGK